ncbi:MAG: hypothetical protein ACK50D_10120 [Burkholderiales bacterium]
MRSAVILPKTIRAVNAVRVAARFAIPSACAIALLALAGCASVSPPEKRHSPAEIAAYQPRDFVAPITSEEGERAAREEVLAKIREASSLPPGFDPGGVVPGALSNIGFLQTEFALGRRLALESLPTLASKDPAYQRGVLSAMYTWYAKDTAPMLVGMLDRFVTPREFAIAAYTIDAGFSAQRDAVRAGILATLQRVFPAWESEPRLKRLHYALSNDLRAVIRTRPPLADLLAHPILPGKPVVFSLQRQDRRRFGVAVVRGADGQFVRNADGSVFHVAHLANAITNLPGTITNGNTPQGLFTIAGAGTATNKWIGPTPYLESKVPFEASVAEFEHTDGGIVQSATPTAATMRTATLTGAAADPNSVWTEARYLNWWPASWRQYTPILEAYLAGQAGRDEMLIHGTTVSSSYYRGRSYYPGTPSAGCLVAMETWNPQDGRLQTSDQLSLIKAFTRDGLDRGYLVVVELDDRLEPVTLAEILPDLLAAESRIPALLKTTR